MMVIYLIINQVNGKVYVGQTKDLAARIIWHRKASARRKNTRLYNSMSKHGFGSFLFEILDTAQNRAGADKKEIYYISAFDSNNPLFGYNMTSGGGGGDTWTLNTHKDITSKRLSESIRNSEKHKSSLNTKEYKEMTSRRSRENWKNPIFRNKIISKKKGKPCSLEHRLAMSRGGKGKILSPEHKKHIGEAVRKRFSDPMARLAISNKLKGRPSNKKGRTWEDIYGIDRAKKIKENKSNAMSEYWRNITKK